MITEHYNKNERVVLCEMTLAFAVVLMYLKADRFVMIVSEGQPSLQLWIILYYLIIIRTQQDRLHD